MNIKKVLLTGVGGLIAFFLLLAAIGLYLVDQGLLEEPASNYHDPRLEQLRDRSAELDEIYDGRAAILDAQFDDEDPFVSHGQLSNFDSLRDPTTTPDPIVDEAISNMGDDSEWELYNERELHDDGFHPADAVDPSEQEIDLYAMGELDAGLSADTHGPADTTEPAFEAPSSPFNGLPSRGASVSKTEVEALINTAIDKALSGVITPQLLDDKLHLQKRKLDSIERQLEQMPELARRSVMEALNARGNGEVDTLLSALSERIDTLESAARGQRQRAAQPSATQLHGLYRLERIVGDTAVLIGQNSGRHFTFREGDAIAHGGTVARISGDSVTLRWPSTQTTLSIF